ncbi:sortase [Streptomyces sp. NPDC055961]|uniref:sortase n=1 Tax=Streptomyces sp. NPDC055961 TaxID=3345666 RepID=UPI0035DCED05
MSDAPHSPDSLPTAQPTTRPRRTRRALAAGIAAVTVAGLATTALLVTRGNDEPSTRAHQPAATQQHAATEPASTVPDPLTSSATSATPDEPAADEPIGGDPKVPDRTVKAQSDASAALDTWSSSNPKGSGPHSVGGNPTTGGGGAVTEVLRIPALGNDWAQPVYEGVTSRQLRAGVGHFPGTERPGQIGNYAIAGHRSGVASPAFKNIDRIKPGASISVTTANRVTYTYKVASVQTVDPSNVNVIAQVPGKPTATPTKPVLTLVTCWPANGSSKRVVITADLVRSSGGTSVR